jgi:uncharacterized repeat protein (TIGR03803 family)
MSKLHWGKRACGIFLLWAATAVALPAQTLTVLHSFDITDGAEPDAPLVQATDGNLYGITHVGGTHLDGTVFNITTGGALTSLHSFAGTDGSLPAAALVPATNGNLYGSTEEGGTAGNCTNPAGCGTIFKLTTGGALATIYNFCHKSDCADGEAPAAALLQAIDGDFYGTTSAGGAGGYGTVFTGHDTLTTLHSFAFTDGAVPSGALIQASNGNFYGTTAQGGANGEGGTIFELAPGGKLTTLYSFCSQINCTDGNSPTSSLVEGTDGNFYGTASMGGAYGVGTVFKITPKGALTTLYNFCPKGFPNCPDGAIPTGGLVLATDGNFYGTTFNAGGGQGGGYGTVFKVTPGGTLTTLYNFCSQAGCADGAAPYAGLLQATDGNFYGTTQQGGAHGDGEVFSLSVGLGPFVETLPDGGKVGATIDILGTDLTGATSVTFNGTAASFKVVSGSLIEAKVPSGATTGIVRVKTPGGTLSSNLPFYVLK